MKWTIPERIIERARNYVTQGRVRHVYADEKKQIWHAEVMGTDIYKIVLDGTLKEEDVCECPYYREHGYCKHTVAVELFLRQKGLNRIIYENPVMRLPKMKKKQSESTLLTQALKKLNDKPFIPKTDLKKLKIQYILTRITTNKYHEEQDIFALYLRISRIGKSQGIIVRDLAQFFDAFGKEKYFEANNNNSFYLSHEAFVPEEVSMIFQLKDIYETYLLLGQGALLVDGKREKRFLLMPKNRLMSLCSEMIALNHFFYETAEEKYTEIIFSENPTPLEFKIKQQEEGSALLLLNEKIELLEKYQLLLLGNQFIFLEKEQLAIIKQLIKLMNNMEEKAVFYKEETMTELFSIVLPFLKKVGTVEVDENVSNAVCYAPLSTSIYLKKKKGSIDVRIDFDYDGDIFSTDPSFNKETNPVKKVIRDSEKEQAVIQCLEKFHFRNTETGFEKTIPERLGLFNFFTIEIQELRRYAKIYIGKKLSSMFLDAKNYEPKINIQERGSWLDVRFDISGIDKHEIDNVLNAMLRQDEFVVLNSGAVLSFDSEEIQKTADILNAIRQGKRSENGAFSLSRVQGISLMSKFKKEFGVHFSQSIEKMAENLIHPENFEVDLPQNLQADLRYYQKQGFQWLKMLHFYGFGGILADEMGLGKTVQTITYLLSEKEEGRLGKTLIVVPASLSFNWLAEFEKFAPDIKVSIVVGNKEERDEKILKDKASEVFITSYASFRQDVEEYVHQDYGCLILDEAQTVKNSATKISQSLKRLNVAQTFALSGTPIENNLEELWNIFQIILPGLFPSKQKYRGLAVEEISKMVRPFILRRVKSEVLQDLPEKIENNLYSPLTPEQKKVYLAYLQKMQTEVTGLTQAEFRENRFNILAGITRLRQICDDPRLFIEGYEGTSGKLEQVKELLIQAKENNRRVLLFSQFTGMLTIIEQELQEIGLSSYYLRGSTKPKDRLDMVDKFNEGEKDVFLISLKAGGTGLNLTGADMVILYDLWWNPAVEEQAAARAHRIGQKNVVEVWRMIAQGTIEEKMYQLQQEKKELFQQVIVGKGTASQSLSKEDIEMILNVGEEDL